MPRTRWASDSVKFGVLPLLPNQGRDILAWMSFLNPEGRVRFSPDKMQKVNLFETADLFCDVYGLEPGQGQKAHTHMDATKFYYVVQGQGEFRVGDVTRPLSAGELAYAEPGEVHGVTNTSAERLVLLVAMGPNPNTGQMTNS